MINHHDFKISETMLAQDPQPLSFADERRLLRLSLADFDKVGYYEYDLARCGARGRCISGTPRGRGRGRLLVLHGGSGAVHHNYTDNEDFHFTKYVWGWLGASVWSLPPPWHVARVVGSGTSTIGITRTGGLRPPLRVTPTQEYQAQGALLARKQRPLPHSP